MINNKEESIRTLNDLEKTEIEHDEIISTIKKEKIKALREEYKKQLDEVNKLDQDITNFEKTFNGARRLLLLDIIRDLEELLK